MMSDIFYRQYRAINGTQLVNDLIYAIASSPKSIDKIAVGKPSVGNFTMIAITFYGDRQNIVESVPERLAKTFITRLEKLNLEGLR